MKSKTTRQVLREGMRTFPGNVGLDTPIHTQGDTHDTQPLHERVDTQQTSDTHDTQGKQGRVRGVCPQCGTQFKPVNKWHTFCCSTCKDAYHNERNPERKQHMKRRKG